jgi:hypothetical protein
MSRMRRSLSVKNLALAVAGVLLAVALFVAFTPTNEAVFGPGVTIYYSNSSYTTVVGARGTGCCGAVINWGIVTKWKKFEQIYCTDQVCPN